MTDWDLWDSDDSSLGSDASVELKQSQKELLISILKKIYNESVVVSEYVARSVGSNNERALSSVTRVIMNFLLEESNKTRAHSLILKELPKDWCSRFFVADGQFDLREINFYTQIVPDLKAFQKKQLALGENRSGDEIPLPVPTCHYTEYFGADGVDGDTAESVLVLDDLFNQDFYNINFQRGMSYDETEVALKAIARMHAHSLAMKVIEGQPLSERYPFLFQTAKATNSYQQLVERGLPQLTTFLKYSGHGAMIETLHLLQPRTEHIISALLAPEGPVSLITHTDFWCSNLMFRDGPDGLECGILDWQMVTYSRPTNDIALLIVSSLPTKLRRKNTKKFLDIYWKTLTSTCCCLGVDIPKDLGYTRDDLSRDYRRSQLLALLLCIGSVDVALGDSYTEQRLIDVLTDLQNEGVFADEIAIASSANNSESAVIAGHSSTAVN
ncbi:uncharacterized protein LOC143145161 [Ptiloglossa arizonensis]|uniref:uncharacterized protein LOC143145161 n=1 Tax=Ptiloglossa arizonensis TaxID=3350558 RepID=UPI003FA143CB